MEYGSVTIFNDPHVLDMVWRTDDFLKSLYQPNLAIWSCSPESPHHACECESMRYVLQEGALMIHRCDIIHRHVFACLFLSAL